MEECHQERAASISQRGIVAFYSDKAPSVFATFPQFLTQLARLKNAERRNDMRIVSWNAQLAAGIDKSRCDAQISLLQSDSFFNDADVIIIQEWRSDHYQSAARSQLSRYTTQLSNWYHHDGSPNRMLILSRLPISGVYRSRKRWIGFCTGGKAVIGVYIHPSIGGKRRLNTVPNLASCFANLPSPELAIGDFNLDNLTPANARGLATNRALANSFQPLGRNPANLDWAIAPRALAVGTLPGFAAPHISDHLPISVVI